MKELHRAKPFKPGWLTIQPIVHVGRRRAARELPLRLEPGRKLILGQNATIRRRTYQVIGFGYEKGEPSVHLELIKPRPHEATSRPLWQEPRR